MARKCLSLEHELDKYRVLYPPGHYYSPHPSIREVRSRERNLFADKTNIPGVNLNEDMQLRLLHQLIPYYGDLPFSDKEKENKVRYTFDNNYFCHIDVIILYCLMRHLRPS